jgi:hypothetical protein
LRDFADDREAARTKGKGRGKERQEPGTKAEPDVTTA